MPIYEMKCDNCDYEWEDIYHHTDPVPTVCPECEEEGSVRRLISLPSQGKVELYGRDLKAKLVSDGRKLKQEALTNETVLANVIGEERFHTNELALEKVKKERPKIKTTRNQEINNYENR